MSTWASGPGFAPVQTAERSDAALFKRLLRRETQYDSLADPVLDLA